MLPDKTLSYMALDRLYSMLRKGKAQGDRDDWKLSTSVLLKPLIRFGASREAMDAVHPGLHDDVLEPNYPADEERRDETMRAWVSMLTELARYASILKLDGSRLSELCP